MCPCAGVEQTPGHVRKTDFDSAFETSRIRVLDDLTSHLGAEAGWGSERGLILADAGMIEEE
jgi:hypothetical protein